jgi:hypothetical protein
MQGLAVAYIHKDNQIHIHEAVNHFAQILAVAAVLTGKQVSDT